MRPSLAKVAAFTLSLGSVFGYRPIQTILRNDRYYDIQAHRGGRGETVESTLPAFANALMGGATTLELDNGITKDGVVVVWHDENIAPEKCRDTAPVTEDDPGYPYVGKFVSNLTFAQLQTLDCGSKRLKSFPQQQTYPGARIQSLKTVMDFVACADPGRHILWNIESKIDPIHPNRTLGVEDFVYGQHAVFSQSEYSMASITYQSFDWRTLVVMKALEPRITTSALVDEENIAESVLNGTVIYPWLANVDLSKFNATTLGGRIAQAAASIGAGILSPSSGPNRFGEGDSKGLFTTKAMVDEVHRLGMKVKPWTVNSLDVADQLARWEVDGIITDYPHVIRRWAAELGFAVAPKYPKQKVRECLNKFHV